LLLDRFLRESSVPSAFPVRSGWVSSGYGARTDPFNGTTAWHNGIDIAGRLGTEVLSVAAGVVSNIEDQEGLGHLVEVTHDGGFLTRYGHNQEVLVAVGDLVEKGEPIALMGSSGRSTGPHVHLEVFKNGRSVDPASYIQRYTR
jgi:murein DD-endopeptidase MepM/ murein hydrolase activator NlpD